MEALRFGWVDSTVKPVDDLRSMQWFAPRRAGSMWTRINKGRVARLEEAGLMEPAGAAAIADARQTGMWTLMDDVEDLVVPADLAAAFDRHPGSREHWESWSASAQKMILTWIVLAKRPETRAARVETTAEKAAPGREVPALARLRQTAQPSGPHASPSPPVAAPRQGGRDSDQARSSTWVKTSVGCAPETPYFSSMTKNGTPVAP